MLAAFLKQINTIINFFLSTYILILLVFFKSFEIANEGFVILSLSYVFTLGFSANLRNIYLGSNNYVNIKKIIKFRFVLSLFTFPFVLILTYNLFEPKNFFLYFSLISLTYTSWFFELVIARDEKNNEHNFNQLILQIILIISTPLLIFSKNLELLSFALILYCLISYLLFKNFFLKILFIKNYIFKSNIILSLGFFSSLAKVFSNFFFRFFILLFAPQNEVSILYLGFIFGSLFGTIFDVSYGALFLKKFKNRNYFINIIFFIYLLFCFFFFYLIDEFKIFEEYEKLLLIKVVLISIVGSYLSIHSLIKRQYFYEKYNFQNTCYVWDIVLYFFIFILIPILNLISTNYFIFSYFLCSLLSYLIYCLVVSNVHKKRF